MEFLIQENIIVLSVHLLHHIQEVYKNKATTEEV